MLHARICVILIALSTAPPLRAVDLSPLGVWRTIDDKTHQVRGLVRLYEKNGELFGRIQAIFDPKEAKERCDRCSGDRKDKPVLDMVIMWNMKKRGSEYTDGEILDPDTGQVYRCRIALEDGGRKLVVRGFVGIALLGRSQVWLRQE
jgi:uncharacterized protein (DUF2147 family)